MRNGGVRRESHAGIRPAGILSPQDVTADKKEKLIYEIHH